MTTAGGRHEPDEVTDAIDRAVDGIEDLTDEFVAAAARRMLEKVEWVISQRDA